MSYFVPYPSLSRLWTVNASPSSQWPAETAPAYPVANVPGPFSSFSAVGVLRFGPFTYADAVQSSTYNPRFYTAISAPQFRPFTYPDARYPASTYNRPSAPEPRPSSHFRMETDRSEKSETPSMPPLFLEQWLTGEEFKDGVSLQYATDYLSRTPSGTFVILRNPYNFDDASPFLLCAKKADRIAYGAIRQDGLADIDGRNFWDKSMLRRYLNS